MPMANVNGTNINYKVEGQGDPLIMIMGFGSTKGRWSFQIRSFRKYYRIITFDNRGIGKSDKPRALSTETMLMDPEVCWPHTCYRSRRALEWS